MFRFSYRHVGALAMVCAVTVMMADTADARRGGSFGSRGARSHAAPTATPTAPQNVPPVQRSMAQDAKPAPAASTANPAARPGGSRFGGFGGGLLGGLLAGGLIGALLGGGLGSLAGGGMMMALLQIALFAGLAWLVMSFFRRKARPAAAASSPHASMFAGGQPSQAAAHPFMQPGMMPSGAAPVASEDIPITPADQSAFEQLLADVQHSFAAEDYAGLREQTTPEMMSYLAEELSQNATNGLRNEVRDTRLIQADVAEAWREGMQDFATIAMRYESIDIMRDRQSGALVSGDPNRPTTTTEIWTFTRAANGPWKLSAIQDA